jgi:uncharacterized membrane protein
MKRDWKRELPSWIALGVAFAASAVTWRHAPPHLAVHWNLHGTPDRTGGPGLALGMVPLVATAAYLLMRFLPRIDPGRANYALFWGAYDVIRTAVVVFMVAVHMLTLGVIHGARVNVVAAATMLAGALLVVLGGAMGKLRPNWFVGIRTPWTLSSKTAWVRTHRLGGWLFVGAGVAMIAAALAMPRWAPLTILLGVLGPASGAVIYSYFVWRHATDRLPPAGTSPAD